MGRACRATAISCLSFLALATGCEEAAPEPVAAQPEASIECDAGDVEACFEHGKQLTEDGTAEDLRGALERFEKACRSEHAEACLAAGRAYEAGRGADADDAVALERFGQACRAGLAAGCGAQGAKLAFSQSADLSNAIRLLETGCRGDDGDSCDAMGQLVMEGKAAGDSALSATLFERGCKLGTPAACTRLGFLADHGIGMPRNQTRAARLYERSCEGGHAQGCHNLASLHDLGQGVARDADRAQTLFRKACDSGLSESCFELAGMLEDTPDHEPAKVADLYRKACEREYGLACANLGFAYLRGRGVEASTEHAARFFGEACDLGSAMGCVGLGELTERGDKASNEDKLRAADLYARACEDDEPRGCFNLGTMHLAGDAVKKDKRKAIKLLRKACKVELASACDALKAMRIRRTARKKKR